jgi:hypothetical protein
MSFSTRVTEATKGANAGQLTALRSAFTTAQTALDAAMVTYGSPKQEKIALQDRLIDLARTVSKQLKHTHSSLLSSLLLEDGTFFLLETDFPRELLLE